LLQLMHLLLAGSLSSPRMMRSFLSSSFIRLAITAGSTRSKPLNTTAKGTKNHNQNTRNGPRSGESGQIHPPAKHLNRSASSHLRARPPPRCARAAGRARDPAHARVRRPRTRRDDERKGSPLLLLVTAALLRCATVNKKNVKTCFFVGVLR
jgi:hypothetical protein